MSPERVIVGEELIPFRELPYKPLSDTDRELAMPIAARIRAKALSLLGNSIDAFYENGIYIMGSRFANKTGYAGVEVLIERFHPDKEDPEANEREFSIAFYSDLILGRPNAHVSHRQNYSDGSVEIDEGDEPNEDYEVGAEELERLLVSLEDCTDDTLKPPSRLSQYLSKTL